MLMMRRFGAIYQISRISFKFSHVRFTDLFVERKVRKDGWIND